MKRFALYFLASFGTVSLCILVGLNLHYWGLL